MGRDDSNDYELLYAIYQMDENGLQALIDKYSVVVMNTLRNYFIKSILTIYVDELFQEAMILLYEAIYGYRDDFQASFATYYRNILHNKLTNFYRTLSTHESYCVRSSVSLDYRIGSSGKSILELLPNEDISLEGTYYLYQMEMARLISKYADHLNCEEKSIFLLRIKGYSYNEIANMLKVNEKRVDNTLHKIRKQKV